MPSNPTDHISVYSTARPTRIAFLVNPEECPTALLDSILEYNSKLWGGRMNPVIPVHNGAIPPGYWNFLKYYDPDIVYSYVQLTDALISNIDRQVGPHYISRHKKHNDGAPENFFPQLNGAFLKVDFSSYPHGMPRLSRPSLSLLTCRNYPNWEHYHFCQTNFGVFNDEHFHGFSEEVKPVPIPAKASIEELLGIIASKRSLVFPWQFTCAEVPLREYHSGKNNGHDCFTVVVGDSVWNWLYMWNRSLLLPAWKRTELNQLYLPAAIADSPNSISLINKLISNHVWQSGAHPPTVVFASYDLTDDELQTIASGLATSGSFFKSVRKLSCDFTELEKCADSNWYPSPKFKQHDYVSDGTFYLKPPAPHLTDKPLNGSWVADLQIEYRPNKFAYTNQAYWWKLPRIAALASCFFEDGVPPGRITAEGYLSVSVGGEKLKDLCLTIPPDQSVISALLTNNRAIYYTDDARNDLKTPKAVYQHIKYSDKGRYLNGYLSLVGNLYRAGNLVENHFWRTIFRAMCGITSENESRVIKVLETKLLKSLPNICSDYPESPEERSRYCSEKAAFLASLFLRLSRNLTRPWQSIRFETLLNRFVEERGNFVRSNTGFESDPEKCRADLLDSLGDLVSLKILLQGVNPVCPRCGSHTWVSIDSIRSSLACQGCQQPIHIPPEIVWEYKLNSLVQDAIQEHGTFPVVWVLHQLLGESRVSFMFSSSLELCADFAKPPLAEIDLACIQDGKFVIGEVKTKAAEFSPTEIEKLCLVARNVMPNEVLVGAFDASSNKLEEVAMRVREGLKDTDIHVRSVCPTEQINDPEYHLAF